MLRASGGASCDNWANGTTSSSECPIPTLASNSNCLSSNELRDQGVPVDTETDTELVTP